MILSIASKILTELPGTMDCPTCGRALVCALESCLLASESLLGGKDLSEEIFDFLLVRLKPVPSVL